MSVPKYLLSTIVLFVTVVFCSSSYAQQADVSFQVFYDQLGSDGNWIQVQDYGYCFQPNVTDPDWAPYREGHWAYSDSGWTWISSEPWGWATYHYGRWANIDGTGWVWVPGNRWAPAWVSWRNGSDYTGWAPLPPQSFCQGEYEGNGNFGVAVGLNIGSNCDSQFQIGAGWYNFVPHQYLGDNDYRQWYAKRGDNYGIINRTTNVTNINVANNVTNLFGGVQTGGPSIDEINRASRTPIARVKLESASQVGEARMNGNSLAVYAPHFTPNSQKEAKPIRVAQTVEHAEINHGTDAAKPLQVTRSVSPYENKPVAQQEQKPATEKPNATEEKKAQENKPVTQQEQKPATEKPNATEEQKAQANKPMTEDHKPATENRSISQDEQKKVAEDKHVTDEHTQANNEPKVPQPQQPPKPVVEQEKKPEESQIKPANMSHEEDKKPAEEQVKPEPRPEEKVAPPQKATEPEQHPLPPVEHSAPAAEHTAPPAEKKDEQKPA